MKKILFSVAFVTMTLTSYSQSFNYNELGALFSRDEKNGTARFNAMSGAFGSLGSDLSAVDINPAGGAVANNSKFSATLYNRSLNNSIRYHNSNSSYQDDILNIAQAGGIFVFDTNGSNSGWNKFAFSFNYRLKADFDNVYSGRGNNNQLPLFNEHPDDTSNQFNNGIEQNFRIKNNGQTSAFNVGMSAVHDKRLYVGASLKFHSLEFQQKTFLSERNEDDAGNTLSAANQQYSYFDGNGFSFNLGFIYKLNKYLRVGLAYESPTWYGELYEENDLNVFDPSNDRYDDWIGYTEIQTNTLSQINTFDNYNLFDDRDFLNSLVYQLRTPSRVTASTSLIFGKQGLISFDYTYKNFTNIRFSDFPVNDNTFNDANDTFSTGFRDTHSFSVGTEWRFDRLSIRGGAFYEKNPNLLVGGDTNIDNVKGYSGGLGYNFGNAQFDLSYQRSDNTQFQSLYNRGDVNVDRMISRLSATITINL